MKNLKITRKLLGILSISLIAILSTACSDEKAGNSAPEKSAVGKQAKPHHVDSGEATDSIKQKFVNAFAKNCVARELKNSINKDVDEKRFEDSCGCIAKHIAEDLSDLDAEKYLQEHEDTQTLEIKFDQAAFFCLQNKQLPKGPHLFGK